MSESHNSKSHSDSSCELGGFGVNSALEAPAALMLVNSFHNIDMSFQDNVLMGATLT